MTVTVYTKPNCPACTLTKRHLDKLGVPYREAHVEEVYHAAKDRGITAAPVVQAGPDMWGGYRPDRIEALVAAA